MFNFKQPDLSFADQYEARRVCSFDGASGIIGAGGSLISGLMGSSAASSAASAQVKAAQIAADTQRQMYMQNRQDQLPWMNEGRSALSALAQQYGFPDPQSGAMGTGVNQDPYNKLDPQAAQTPWLNAISTGLSGVGRIMDEFTGPAGPSGYSTGLESKLAGFKGSPDYQFARDEALRTGLQASNVGGGGGGGGRLMDLENRASGLASQNYNTFAGNIFKEGQQGLDASARVADIGRQGGTMQMDTTSQIGNLYNQYFNRLASMANIGQTATGQLGQQGTQAAGQLSGYQAGAGQATASGIIGSNNALTGGLTNSIGFLTGANGPFGPNSGSGNANSSSYGYPGASGDFNALTGYGNNADYGALAYA